MISRRRIAVPKTGDHDFGTRFHILKQEIVAFEMGSWIRLRCGTPKQNLEAMGQSRRFANETSTSALPQLATKEWTSQIGSDGPIPIFFKGSPAGRRGAMAELRSLSASPRSSSMRPPSQRFRDS